MLRIFRTPDTYIIVNQCLIEPVGILIRLHTCRGQQSFLGKFFSAQLLALISWFILFCAISWASMNVSIFKAQGIYPPDPASGGWGPGIPPSATPLEICNGN